MDTKETTEILVALHAAVDALEAAKAGDGEVTVRDLPKFLPVVPKMVAALKDAQKIKDELKELSPEEMEALLGSSLDLAMKVAKVVFGVELAGE